MDIVPEFTQSAAAKLAAHGIPNVTLETGDAARGWDRHGPYDAIVLTGSVPLLPEASSSSLAPGGRLLAIVGEPPVMEARLVTCVAAGACSTHRPVRDLHRAAQERARSPSVSCSERAAAMTAGPLPPK